MRLTTLVIVLCISLQAEENITASNLRSTAPQSGFVSDLVEWGGEAFGGYRMFNYSDGVRNYVQVSRCHTSGLRTSEDAVYEALGDSFTLLFVRPAILGERRLIILNGNPILITIGPDGELSRDANR